MVKGKRLMDMCVQCWAGLLKGPSMMGLVGFR